MSVYDAERAGFSIVQAQESRSPNECLLHTNTLGWKSSRTEQGGCDMSKIAVSIIVAILALSSPAVAQEPITLTAESASTLRGGYPVTPLTHTLQTENVTYVSVRACADVPSKASLILEKNGFFGSVAPNYSGKTQRLCLDRAYSTITLPTMTFGLKCFPDVKAIKTFRNLTMTIAPLR